MPLVPGPPEFGTLQMSLLEHNRRLKQRDSLPLNAARAAGGSEVLQCGPGAKLRYEVPQKLKLFARNI